MARNGYRIFDADTHVGPTRDVIERYLAPAERAKLEPLHAYRRLQKRTGQMTSTMGQRSYTHRLGLAEAVPPNGAGPSGPDEYMRGFTGAHKGLEPDPRVDHEPAVWIKDLDLEGVDVNLTLPSGWFGCWTTVDDVSLELALDRAYNRWMADYRGAYPDRLGVHAGVPAEGDGRLAGVSGGAPRQSLRPPSRRPRSGRRAADARA